jgi:small-conductance mechanosensitive channel
MTLSEFLRIQLFEVSGTQITVSSLVTFTVIVLLSLVVSSLVRRVARRALGRMGWMEAGTISTILRLLHYGVVIVGLAVAAQTIGISLASLFAAGAVVAVAVGFALQNVLQNFVSGVILLAERSITESDVLEVDGEQVVVERLGARATVARTRDDDQIIIPNSVLVQSSVTNLTLADSLHRIRARVGVSYGSDMARVEEVLLRAAGDLKNAMAAKEPVALLLEFADSSVVWELSVWIDDPWAARVTRSDLNKAIWAHFQRAGIVIAFPQLDVHLTSAEKTTPPDSSSTTTGA